VGALADERAGADRPSHAHNYSWIAMVMGMPDLRSDADLSVSDAARAAGLSHARVGRLVREGRVPSRKIGSQHVIVDVNVLLSMPRRVGRPLSERSAWVLLLHANGHRLGWMSPKDVYRAKAHVNRLAADPEPELALQALVRNRAERLSYHAQEPAALLADDDLALSGVSDPRAGMSAGSEVEGYVHQDDVPRIVRRHLLVAAPNARANVWLHSSPFVPDEPLRLQVAADLAEHGGPRERNRARKLIRDVLSGPSA